MHPTHAVEAITLKATPFEEHAYILKLFSKEQGRISCVVKTKKGKGHTGFSPLLRVDADVVISEKELWKCPRCQVTNSYPRLRLRLDTLQNAVQISEFLSYALPSHLPVPELYEQFQEFLTHIASFEHPHAAASIFLAKFCAQEGMLGTGSSLSKEELATCERFIVTPFQEQYQSSCDKSVLRKLLVIAGR